MMLRRLNMTANESGRRQDTAKNVRYCSRMLGMSIGIKYSSEVASNLREFTISRANTTENVICKLHRKCEQNHKGRALVTHSSMVLKTPRASNSGPVISTISAPNASKSEKKSCKQHNGIQHEYNDKTSSWIVQRSGDTARTLYLAPADKRDHDSCTRDTIMHIIILIIVHLGSHQCSSADPTRFPATQRTDSGHHNKDRTVGPNSSRCSS